MEKGGPDNGIYQEKQKSILEILFLVLLVAFTFMRSEDQELDEINQVLKTAEPGLAHRGAGPGYCFCLQRVGDHSLYDDLLGKKTKLHQCIRYSFIGFFYSCITFRLRRSAMLNRSTI